ncbi:hypothetical protein J15TS10_06300 [Paenibacillus woosongensis]|uniref:DUF4044 domain-containing protein n=2 Tax=Paenibacillus woosongensis TaxID=307580 RepID=A0ABQ4MLF8_9BACL|nr:hypothetical protein J15TS10_06300 [Paenibacillus woosongensis]
MIVVMAAKRKPPTLQQKKEEVNKKGLIWAISIVAGLIILFTLALVFK